MAIPSRGVQQQRIYWLLPVEWLAHFADESTAGFPEWATRHFAPLPRPLWIVGMWILTVLVALLSRRAARPHSRVVFPWLACAFQTILFCNGCFHLIATLGFGEYSPGTATGALVFLPASWWFFRVARRDPRMVRPRLALAIAQGFVVHGLVVVSLYFDKSW